MHAYLLIGSDTDSVNKTCEELISKNNLVKYEWSINKIAEVRSLEKFIRLSLSQPTAIVIHNFESASVAAQNAFLKSLEEPHSLANYIILAETDANILPTIISRCSVIKLNSQKQFGEKLLEQASDFTKGNFEKRYQIINKITKREDAIEFTEAILSQKADVSMLKKALFTHNALQRNGNVGLQLTSLAIT